MPHFRPVASEDRQHVGARRRRMGRAFQHDELTGPQRLGDRPRGPFDVAQIGIAALVERRRHADDDAVGFGQAAHVGGRLELVLANQLRERRRVDVLDVALAGLQLVDLRLIDVEAQAAKPAAVNARISGRPT